MFSLIESQILLQSLVFYLYFSESGSTCLYTKSHCASQWSVASLRNEELRFPSLAIDNTCRF